MTLSLIIFVVFIHAVIFPLLLPPIIITHFLSLSFFLTVCVPLCILIHIQLFLIACLIRHVSFLHPSLRCRPHWRCCC